MAIRLEDRRADAAVTDRPARRLTERVSYGALALGVVVCGYLLVLTQNSRFFYQDDVEGGAVPQWLKIGRRLREGELPVLSPGEWMAGNHTVDGQAGVWNPVHLLISYVGPSFDNLAVYATTVSLAFSLLLALGVHRVALAYGAAAHWSAAVAAAAPFAGFTLYYDAATWIPDLICTAYVVNAWASALRYTRGQSGPVATFAFLYLTISTGYPYGVVAAALVMAAVLGGHLVQRSGLAPLVRLTLVGVAALACGIVTYLPGALSAAATFRAGVTDPLFNDNFLVAPWSESLLSVLPTALPALEGHAGEIQLAPVTYIAWFLLPALAFLSWERLRPRLPELAGPLLLAAALLLYTAGPSRLGPLRWPGRLLPYLSVTLLILLAVALTTAVTVHRVRARAAVALAVVGLGVYRAFAVTPDSFRVHLTAGAVVVALGAAAALAWRLGGQRATAAALALSVLPVLVLQLQVYPRNANVADWNFPTSRSAASDAFPAYPGSTLQLADLGLVTGEERSLDKAWDSLVFANYARLLDRDYVNAYTPVGHARFAELVCMREKGASCPDAYRRVFSIEPTTDLRYVDLMAVDRVVLQRRQYSGTLELPPPPGWDRVAVDDDVIVLERAVPDGRTPGGVATSTGVAVDRPTVQTDRRVRAEVTSTTGGRVVLSRLAWPGYTATLDGRPLPVGAVDGIFVSVDIPAGTRDGDLVVAFDPPGWDAGALAALMGLGLLLALVLVDRDIWRRLQRSFVSRPSARTADAATEAVAGRPRAGASAVNG